MAIVAREVESRVRDLLASGADVSTIVERVGVTPSVVNRIILRPRQPERVNLIETPACRN